MSEDTPVPPPPPKGGLQLNNAVIIGGLLLLTVVLAASELFGGSGLAPQQPAPDIAWRTLEGAPVRLHELRGKIVLLNFWATWCPPCNDEMPELVELAKAYEGKGVVFVAMNPDESPDAVRAWLAHHDDVRPYIGLSTADSASAFRVEALPTTYVIDAQGNVSRSARGRVQGWQVKRWLDDAR